MSLLVAFDQVLRRRAAVRVLASSASVALLAACGVQAPAAPTSTTPPAAAATPAASVPTAAAAPTLAATPQAADQPRRGGTLRAGLVGDVGVINPHAIGPQPLQTIFCIWDRLIVYDTAGKPQPMLAESWDFSSDQTKLQFTLRRGIQFHTGRELTSSDATRRTGAPVTRCWTSSTWPSCATAPRPRSNWRRAPSTWSSIHPPRMSRAMAPIPAFAST